MISLITEGKESLCCRRNASEFSSSTKNSLLESFNDLIGKHYVQNSKGVTMTLLRIMCTYTLEHHL